MSIYTPDAYLKIGVILGKILGNFGIFRFFGGSEISVAENVGWGCGAAEFFSARRKKVQKNSQKNFHDHRTFGSHWVKEMLGQAGDISVFWGTFP